MAIFPQLDGRVPTEHSAVSNLFALSAACMDTRQLCLLGITTFQSSREHLSGGCPSGQESAGLSRLTSSMAMCL